MSSELTPLALANHPLLLDGINARASRDGSSFPAPERLPISVSVSFPSTNYVSFSFSFSFSF